MWRITPIAECGTAPEDLEEIAGALFRKNKGIPNFLRLLAQCRPALLAYARAEEALANGALAASLRERIALAVAEINGSAYCVASHTKNGKRTGLSDAEMHAALKATAADSKTETMLHFVQALVLQRGEVSDEDFAAVRKAGFSEAEIIEILANVVLNIFTNYFNILARTELDNSFCRPAAAVQPVRTNAREGIP